MRVLGVYAASQLLGWLAYNGNKLPMIHRQLVIAKKKSFLFCSPEFYVINGYTGST